MDSAQSGSSGNLPRPHRAAARIRQGEFTEPAELLLALDASGSAAIPAHVMRQLPTGTVTFLFSDVEGSSRLWEEHPAAMRVALARHDAMIEKLVERHEGSVVRPRGEGDSRFCVFARASDAVAAALAIQVALDTEAWPDRLTLRVRIAVHTGEADLRAGDYYGSAVNRCARLRGVAHGGQSLISQTTCDLAGVSLPLGAGLLDLGSHRLQDLAEPEHVYPADAPGPVGRFPAT